MRVLHIVRQFSPAMGGLENFVKSLVLEQRSNGIDAEVLTLNRVFHQQAETLPAADCIDGIPVTRIGYRGSYKYPIAPTISSYLSSYDLIHVHGVDFFVDYLALTAPFHGKPLLLSTHGGFFHTPFASTTKKLLFNTVTRLSLKAYRQVYACSNNDYQRFKPICAPKLLLIENGVDTAKFANAGQQQHQPNMIFIGRFSDNKRIDKLVAMMAELMKLDIDATLRIVGKDWDGNELRLRQQIDRLKLNSQVTLHTDLSDQQVKAQVSNANFIISASEYEGFGLTLIEGMAAGLLPLASNIPSFSRIVEQAQLGQIINFDDPTQAAKSIANYFTSVEPHYPQLRRAAIERAAHYAWPTVAKTFIAQYQQLGLQPKTLQGVQMDSRDGEAVIASLDNAIKLQQPLVVAYANAHTINLARNDSNYRQLLNRCLVLNDGVGVSMASRLKYGQSFSENLNGTDFTPRYFANSQQSLRIFLLGAKPNNVQRCFATWQQQYPQHQWVGYHHGFFDDDQQICKQIADAKANVVIVAMGNPLQERWLDRNLSQTGAVVGIGVGALFDFTAGDVSRAPSWLRKMKLEWLYRLIQEPKRMWRRYLLGNLTFLYNALGDNS
ncbi:WecB/TagA/CpsF family glycosyltransferase [Ferrimonas lipolytica]|uniref:WecB/TagA/CpsF family glycosyltransferase n=1 Tax=Ferrimonas lipolytica TaxID=2724191 RepID=A0A6H1UJQ0_9GAMM|nr:WecB/TagA/CpsF family glycosyltransferase [Ferrimonas lipolytica]QIZ78446.1 WecB/TagA/CpsF family glycosyltransferase [Ferrimonas lipolytica]